MDLMQSQQRIGKVRNLFIEGSVRPEQVLLKRTGGTVKCYTIDKTATLFPFIPVSRIAQEVGPPVWSICVGTNGENSKQEHLPVPPNTTINKVGNSETFGIIETLGFADGQYMLLIQNQTLFPRPMTIKYSSHCMPLCIGFIPNSWACSNGLNAEYLMQMLPGDSITFMVWQALGAPPLEYHVYAERNQLSMKVDEGLSLDVQPVQADGLDLHVSEHLWPK